ncbi:acid protease [Punctularia strigosozonata HHB-11173 SS5]|uniref:acid protease n=1 Tax=Punctularia strigosozonata (strain HHB-11173) TaxID=741275 RepID=UPI0004416BFC|nr:acid protease [Punctularia strigosozonata HHB-11173 SS5]EIN11159.1 acid protease [Punctularia strigosozonata HHB-11173 SS5]
MAHTLALVLGIVSAVRAFNHPRRVVSLPSRTPSYEVLPTASFSASLSRAVTNSSRALEALRASSLDSYNLTSVLTSADGGFRYYADIDVGGQDFKVLVDTGSSDTWLIQKGFSCFDIDFNPETEDECGFGTAGFDPSQSPTFVPLVGKNLNITYGDGTFAVGPVGTDTMTVGGLTVTAQEFGVPNMTAWEGEGIEGGLLGLAYPALTTVHNESDPTLDSPTNLALYNPFLFSAINQGVLSTPVFSVSLDRGTIADEESGDEKPNKGVLAFGGIAPVSVTNTTASAPVLLFSGFVPNAKADVFYGVTVDSYVFPGSTALSTRSFAVLDTGTALSFIPTPIVQAVVEKFVPSATVQDDVFFVDCNATAPAFAVTIAGIEFAVDPKDLILPGGIDDDGNDICISGVQDGGPDNGGDIFILGDTFLHNVVASFDVGANVVHVSQRTPY